MTTIEWAEDALKRACDPTVKLSHAIADVVHEALVEERQQRLFHGADKLVEEAVKKAVAEERRRWSATLSPPPRHQRAAERPVPPPQSDDDLRLEVAREILVKNYVDRCGQYDAAWTVSWAFDAADAFVSELKERRRNAR